MTNPLFTADQLRKVNDLYDLVIEKLGLKNDAALSRALGVAPPVVSKTRAGTLAVSPTMMIRIHDASGMGIAEQRAVLEAPPLVPFHGAV